MWNYSGVACIYTIEKEKKNKKIHYKTTFAISSEYSSVWQVHEAPILSADIPFMFFACAVCSFYCCCTWQETRSKHDPQSECTADSTVSEIREKVIPDRHSASWQLMEGERERERGCSLSSTAMIGRLGHCLPMASYKHWAKKQRVCFNHCGCIHLQKHH